VWQAVCKRLGIGDEQIAEFLAGPQYLHEAAKSFSGSEPLDEEKLRKRLRQRMTNWSDRNDNYPTQPRGDSIQVTRRLWARYSKQIGAQAIKAGD